MRLFRFRVVMSALFITVLLAASAYGGSPADNLRGKRAPAVAKDATSDHKSSQTAMEPKYREGTLLVKFRPGVADTAKNNLHQRHGSKVTRKFERLRLHQLKLKKGISVDEAVTIYRMDPDVEYAEPDYEVTALAIPNDTSFPDLWGMTAIDAPSAWELSTGSPGVVVAVIDSGVDYTHPDLTANMWVNPGETPGNGIDDDGNGYVDDVYGINTVANTGDPLDVKGHGTHVAGTIGAVGNNGVGVTGVNWQVKIMACKFLNDRMVGNESDAIECLEYIRNMKDRGVPVIASNNSWGKTTYTQAVADAIAAQGDILLVAASGNSSANTGFTPHYPASYHLPNIISVASTDSAGGLSSFSNYGQRSVHVAAPGSIIYSTYPGGRYVYQSGTSMAAPHVTGLAALLASRGKDWVQVRNLILTGGKPLATLEGRTLTGSLINAHGSLTCTDRPLFAPLWVPTELYQGTAAVMSALSINCDSPVGPVTLTTSLGQTVALKDDGVLPDLAAGDGIFTGTLIPASSGAQIFTFTSPVTSITVASTPVRIQSDATLYPPARLLLQRNASVGVGENFRLSLGGSIGGLPPYTWSVNSGTLPSGLSLDSATGEISGAPTVPGAYTLTVKVTDTAGMSDFQIWYLAVNEGIRAGWPQILELRNGVYPKSYHPVFADLDGDGRDEVIVADGYTLYVLDANGLVAKTTLWGYVSTPAVANLFKDGNRQIIVGVAGSVSPLYAFNKNLTPIPGFPAGSFPSYDGSGYARSPVVVDFDGDGNQTILGVTTPLNTSDPAYGKNMIVAVDAQGRMLEGWPIIVGRTTTGDERFLAAADLDLDGHKEALLLSNDGVLHIYREDGTEMAQWQVATTLVRAFNPVLADFNGDGFPEIGVSYHPTTSTSAAAIYDRSGNLLPGWPRSFDGSPRVGPIAADLDSDGKAELIFPSGANRNVWQALRADGTSLSGWPVTTPYGAEDDTYPVVGDINGDGEQDILFNTTDGMPPVLSGYSGSGTPLTGFPKYGTPTVSFRTAPALGDVDGNGRVDIAAKTEDGALYLWEAVEPSTMNFQWPMFGHDILHTNAWSVPTAPVTLVDFSASPLIGQAPLFVSFSDTSINSPTAWAWNFGDGGTSASRNPIHVYGIPGVYPVSLTAFGSTGPSTKTRQGYLTVLPCSKGPVRLSGTMSLFADLPGAYASAGENDILQLHATQFSGDLHLNRNIRFTLRGGYDCGYTGSAGASEFLGQLRVSDGTVKLDSVRLK